MMEKLTIKEIMGQYPYAKDFFNLNGLPEEKFDCTISEYIKALPYVFLEDIGTERSGLEKSFYSYMKKMEERKKGNQFVLNSIDIIGGTDKNGKDESINIHIEIGEIVSIVGETGSGKSRLLSDIEWMAQRDTPTKRQILINGDIPQPDWRFSLEHKLVAQLTQNMNFVMDISVEEFIHLHAQSRMLENIEEKAEQIIYYANELSGESFNGDTPLTSLSGGQSRALMVADTAFLSASPIILIDELENAGIHRKKALELLISQEKIVLIATHDPILALSGGKRLIIKNGGIHKEITTSQEEKSCLKELEIMDNIMMSYRAKLRSGDVLQ